MKWDDPLKQRRTIDVLVEQGVNDLILHDKRRRSSEWGFIYVIRCREYHKIGWAANPESRLRDLQIANPFEMTIVAQYRAHRTLEGIWHNEFSHRRVRGEWFALTPSDLHDIQTTIEESGKPGSWHRWKSNVADTSNKKNATIQTPVN